MGNREPGETHCSEGFAMPLASLLEWLAAATGAAWLPVDQRSLIEAMPRERRDQLVSRLRALVPFVAGQTGDMPVAQAAASAGMRRRNFYRLLTELKRRPPYDVLVRSAAVSEPHRSVGPEASAPLKRDEDGKRAGIIVAAIREQMVIDPDARLSVFVRIAKEACVRAGVKPPADLTISRRLDKLREEARAHSPAANVGARVLVDQCAIALAVHGHGLILRALLSIVVDIDSAVILGCGFGHTAGHSQAFANAMSDVRRRADGIRSSLTIGSRLSEATWIVPEEVRISIDGWRSRMQTIDAVGRVVSTGPHRHGVHLRRLLGSSLGVLEFTPRKSASLDPVSERSAANMISLSVEDAVRLMTKEVTAWNASRGVRSPPHEVFSVDPKDAISSLQELFEVR